MIEGDIKKRGYIGWYELAKDRVMWRKIVNGDRVEAGVRRRRKHARKREERGEKEQKESRAKQKAKEIDPEGAKLECKECGKVYNTKRGGHWARHTASCMPQGERHTVICMPLGKEADCVMRVAGGGLECPKCGKAYRSKAGGWYQKHVDVCGSSQL